MVAQSYPIRDTFNKNNNNYLSSQPTMGDGRSVVSIASNVSVCSKLGAKEQGHLIDDVKDGFGHSEEVRNRWEYEVQWERKLYVEDMMEEDDCDDEGEKDIPRM